MSKINNNLIHFGLKILSILAFSLLIVPAGASAAYGTYTYYGTGNNYNGTEVNNPQPAISSISPSSSNRGVGTKTITIYGSGFVPSSVARINGSNRFTTFIDSSHLFVQSNNTDLSRADGFFVTVFNGLPGGGYSNAAFFTINTAAVPAPNTGNNENAPDTFSETVPTENANPMGNDNNANNNYSNLASNAVFGSNSFLPSGLVQWILFAIVILLIVILTRKIFGGKQNYDEAPMKHA